MKVSELEIGKTYAGGNIGERRTLTGWGSSDKYICYGRTVERLPYGGFVKTVCIRTESFANWAVECLG